MFKRLLSTWVGLWLALLGAHAQAQQPRTLTELELTLAGVSAQVADLEPVVPKAIASSLRVHLRLGARDLNADEARALLGGDFQIQGELSGPGLLGTLALPNDAAGVPATNLLALPLPALPVAGDYDLSNLRVVVNGQAVLDVLPVRARLKVIDQILVTQVTTRPLTLEEIRERGIVLDRDDYLAFEFDMGLRLDSQTVSFRFPVVFDRQGVAVPLPLQPPPIPPREAMALPQVRPVLLNVVPDPDTPGGGGPRPDLVLPNGEPIRIPGLLVIPGDVGYLKQFFAAQLFVANGAPRGTSLSVRDVNATITLPLGARPDNSDAPLALPEIVRNGQVVTQPLTMAVRGVGSDGEPNTSDDVDVFAAGEQGQAEFLLRGEREGFHRIDFAIKATLDGLPGPDGVIAPIAIQGSASGGVLVRNPYFDMTFTVPSVVRAGETFPVFVTVANIGQGAAQDFTLSLDGQALGGMQLVDAPGNEPVRHVDRLAVRDAVTFTFRMRSQRTGAVIAKYLKLDGPQAHGSQGQLKFTLGVGERGVPLSPDTLTLPAAVDALPADVVQAALRVLGQAWSVAKAPTGTLPANVRRIDQQTVVSKALALAEAGLRVTLGERVDDAVRDLVFDLYRPQRSGVTIDVGFDQLLRETEAGQALARVLGLHAAASAGGSPLAYEHAFAEVGASGEDFLSFAVDADNAADVSVSDALDRITTWATEGGSSSAVPYLALLPLGVAERASLLGFIGHPQGAYVLALAGRASGRADVSLSLPAGDGATFRRATITSLELRQGSRTFVALDPQQPDRVRITEDLDGDGQADGPAHDVATSTLLSQGPRLIAASVIGPETLDGASEFGVHAALLFDRVVDATSGGDVEHYRLTNNTLVHARRQLSGRLVFAQLQTPEGPYERQAVEASGVTDPRGQAGPTATVDLTSRVQTPGAVVTGRLLEADGRPVQGARILYINTPDGAERCTLPPTASDTGDNGRGIAETRTDAQGQYALRYVKQSAQGCPFHIVTAEPNGGAQRFVSSRVHGAGDRQVLDLVLFGRGGVVGTVRQRASGAPVAGAAVTATSTTDAQSGGRAVSDALGRYTISGLAVGPIAVQAAKSIGSGYASGRIFRAGETATVDVLLDDGAVDVSGRVTRLENGASSAAAGALVSIAYGGVPVGWQYADVEGRYRLAGMPTGAFEVRAQDGGLQSRRTGQAFAGQNVTGHDLVLHLPNVARHDVRGHVVTASGAPAAGVWVFLSEISLPAALTDATGAFTLRAVPVPESPRSYTVYARTADGRRDGSAPVQVTAAGPTPVDVRVRLSGLGTAEFTVVGPTGQPQPGVQVGLLGSCANPCGCASAASDSAGRVRFENRPVGSTRVQAFSYVRPAGSSTSYVDFAEAEALVPGDGATGFGVLRFNGVGTVRVKVVDDHGAPVGGSTVSLRTQQFDAQTCRLLPVTRPAVLTSLTSGTPGEVRFAQMLVGTYDVSASNPFAPGSVGERGVLARHGEDDLVTLTTSDVMAGTLSGAVLLPDGTPAGAGVSVTVSGPIPALSVESDSLGRYAFRRVLPAGRYMLEARDGEITRGLGVAQELLILPPVRDTAFDVRLMGRGTVRVRVVEGDSQPVTRGTLTLREGSFPNGVQRASLEQAVEGVLSLAGVYAGPFSVEVQDAFGRGGRASGVLSAAGATADVTVRVTPTGCVRGRFVMPDGVTAIPFGTVKLLGSGNGAVLGQATTGSDGALAFDYVPLGALRLEAQDPLTGRNGLAAGMLEVEGSQPPQCLDLDVRAEGLGTVIGRVLDNGTPREAIEVEVVSGRYRAKTFSADGGAYRIEGVPSGQVVVTARPPSLALAGSASAVLSGEGATLTLDVALRDSVTVVGRVVRTDGVSAAPPSEVAVSSAVIPTWSPLRAYTDDEGRYRVERVPVGVNTFDADVFDSLDRGRVVRDLVRPASGEVEVDLTLNGVGGLVGRAEDASGQPVAGAVTITGTGAFPFTHYLLVGTDGRFELPEVLAGPVTVRLQAKPGGVSLYGTATVVIAAEVENAVVVRLQDSGTVRGRVLRADGVTPAYGAEVVFERSVPDSYRFVVQTNANGDFMAAGVPLGPVSGRVLDRVTGGVVVLPAGTLASNGSAIDYGTLVLDDAAPRPVFVAPTAGAVSAGYVVPVEIDLGEDAAGLDLSGFRVTYTNGSRQSSSSFTFAGARATGTLEPAWLVAGANHVTVQVVDRAGFVGTAAVDFTAVGARVQVRVQQAGGAPAAGATVQLDGATTRTTDAAGVAEFTGVRPGWHSLVATDPATGRSRVGSVDVADGGVASVTLTLPGAQRIEGVLRGRDGLPAGGQVAVFSADGATEYDRQFTDADGRFVLSAPAASLRLRGSAAGEASYDSAADVVVTVAGAGTTTADALANVGAIERPGQRDAWRFEASAGEVVSLRARRHPLGLDTPDGPQVEVRRLDGALLAPAAASLSFTAPDAGAYVALVRGRDAGPSPGRYRLVSTSDPRVFTAFATTRLAGRVVREGDLVPVAGQGLRVRLGDDVRAEVKTDAEGRYAVDVFPAGTYTIETLEPVAQGTPIVSAMRDVAVSGETVQVPDIEVPARGSVHVHVTRNGVGEPGAIVNLTSDHPTALAADRERTADTGFDGQAAPVSLPVGTIMARAIDPRTNAVVEANGVLAVDATLDLELTFAAAPRANLHGSITARDGVTSLVGASVELIDLGTGATVATTSTDATGAYAVHDVAQGGGYLLAATFGSAAGGQTLELRAPDVTQDLALDVRILRGFAREDTGTPLANTRIAACGFVHLPATTEVCVETRTDAAGAYAIYGLPHWFVYASGPRTGVVNVSTENVTAPWLAASGAFVYDDRVTFTQTLDLVAPPAGTLVGRVRDGASAVSSAAIRIYDPSTNLLTELTADVAGGFSLRLPAGDWRVWATDADGIPGDAWASISAQQTTPIDVLLAPSGTLSGTRLDATGQPTAGDVRIDSLGAPRLQSDVPWRARVVAGSDGAFARRVPVGPWRAVIGDQDCPAGPVGATEGVLVAGASATTDPRLGSHVCHDFTAVSDFAASYVVDTLNSMPVEAYPFVALPTADGRGLRSLRSLRIVAPPGIEVRTETYTPASGAFRRTLTWLSNTSATAATVQVETQRELASGWSWELTATSSGDLELDETDSYVVAHRRDGDDAAFVWGDALPLVNWQFNAEAALAGPVLRVLRGSGVLVAHAVEIPPGEARAVLAFTLSGPNGDATLPARAATLLSLQAPEALADLSPSDRAAIVNFTVPANLRAR